MSYYVIVRVGDAVRQEMINVAVFAYDEVKFRSVVLKDWSRVVGSFDFRPSIRYDLEAHVRNVRGPTYLSDLREWAKLGTQLEVTPAVPSPAEVSDLVAWAAERYLVEPDAYDRHVGWWIRNVIHNCLVHPLLPMADVLSAFGVKTLAEAIYKAHDISVPRGGG